MQGLSASELLEVWERSTHLAEVDRALLLVAWRLHGKSSEELGLLSLDERDRMLLQLRIATFGSRLEAFGRCANCGESLECALDAGSLLPKTVSSTNPDEFSGYRMRAPNSNDMRMAARCSDTREAAIGILRRCVTHDSFGDDTKAQIPIEDVTDKTFATYSAWLEQHAPATEILLDLECPACAGKSSIPLDIASFFWREIEAAAARLVREVDALARMYGWSEAQILLMSTARRALYLEAVGA